MHARASSLSEIILWLGILLAAVVLLFWYADNFFWGSNDLQVMDADLRSLTTMVNEACVSNYYSVPYSMFLESGDLNWENGEICLCTNCGEKDQVKKCLPTNCKHRLKDANTAISLGEHSRVYVLTECSGWISLSETPTIAGNTCCNKISDGAETGIDCGGNCEVGTEIRCSDRVDNDRDCKIDCDDSDCAADPFCTHAPVCGDGTCSPGETNCPNDSDYCPEPGVCRAATCDSGCGSALIPDGEQDTIGVNQCNQYTGCSPFVNCVCDGAGNCRSSTGTACVPTSPLCNGVCPANCSPSDDPDCITGSVCTPDGCKNGNESGVDCGGSCIVGTENPATTCNDTLDNDKDCLADCLDPDCATASNCVACPNGTCAPNENCPDDATSCNEPAKCYLKSCTAGCNNPAVAVASGSQDNDGANKCNATTGCGSPPCQCDGSGGCIHINSCGAGHTDNGDGTCTATFSVTTKVSSIGKSGSSSYVVYTNNDLWFYLNPSSVVYRAYAEWGISGIPSGSTINQVILKYEGAGHVNTGMIKELKAARPSAEFSSSIIFAAIGNGLLYANPASFPVVGPNQSIDLGNAAKTTLQNTQLALGWFALGFQSSNETVAADGPSIAFYSATPRPTLEIKYTPLPPP